MSGRPSLERGTGSHGWRMTDASKADITDPCRYLALGVISLAIADAQAGVPIEADEVEPWAMLAQVPARWIAEAVAGRPA